jgi:hypothetical protein
MVTASATFHGQQLKDIPVLNPGGWWGKTWLIEIGGSYWPLLPGHGQRVRLPAAEMRAEVLRLAESMSR